MLGIVKPNYKINFVKSTSSKNIVDAAVARPIKKEYVTSDIVDLGEIVGVKKPEIGMALKKRTDYRDYFKSDKSFGCVNKGYIRTWGRSHVLRTNSNRSYGTSW